MRFHVTNGDGRASMTMLSAMRNFDRSVVATRSSAISIAATSTTLA